MMPIQIIYTVYDKRGKRATTSVKLGSSETMARVQLFAVAWADAIDNLMGGVIRSAVALLQASIAGLVGNVVGTNADVEEIAEMQFDSVNGKPIYITVPAINENKVLNDTGVLDETDTDVAALLAALVEGLDVGTDTVYVVDTGGGEVADVVYAREASRNSGTRKV